jgi:hypothetical protein
MTLTQLAQKHNLEPESAKAITPCGGCGETDQNKRCLGCLHDFHAEQALIGLHTDLGD